MPRLTMTLADSDVRHLHDMLDDANESLRVSREQAYADRAVTLEAILDSVED